MLAHRWCRDSLVSSSIIYLVWTCECTIFPLEVLIELRQQMDMQFTMPITCVLPLLKIILAKCYYTCVEYVKQTFALKMDRFEIRIWSCTVDRRRCGKIAAESSEKIEMKTELDMQINLSKLATIEWIYSNCRALAKAAQQIHRKVCAAARLQMHTNDQTHAHFHSRFANTELWLSWKVAKHSAWMERIIKKCQQPTVAKLVCCVATILLLFFMLVAVRLVAASASRTVDGICMSTLVCESLLSSTERTSLFVQQRHSTKEKRFGFSANTHHFHHCVSFLSVNKKNFNKIKFRDQQLEN